MVPDVSFEHLFTLSDPIGLFEHAELTVPRREHAYCVDDVARGLLIVAREPHPSARLAELTNTYLQFVLDAQTADGRFHNRRALDGSWPDEATLEDCWGRALWGLGTVVRRTPELADRALRHFDRSVDRRAPWSRAMCFAALGAAEVLEVRPDHAGARALLADTVTLIGPPAAHPQWPWPEARLRYANAALPEVLLAAGALLGDESALRNGLDLLGWLLETETAGDHLSVTPVAGWSPGEARPGFDQQPIEVAAIADVCARAYDITGDSRWKHGVLRSADWFLGANDVGVVMIDVLSGGGCDGLESNGRNENQGAESTLAMISTFQRVHRMLAPAR